MSKRPNIVVIIVDQLRADMAGCYGNSFCKTPNLDSLARSGTTFTRAYCTFPQCSPSRASIMTGLLPNKTGIGIQSDCRAFGSLTVERLAQTIPSIGTTFRTVGYRTGYVGKWHLSTCEPPADLKEYGFDFYYVSPPHVANPVPFAGAAETRRGAVAGIGESTASWEGRQATQAVKFIRKNVGADEPFLLFYSDGRPHPPYFVTKDDFEKWSPQDVPLWGNIHDDLKGKPRTHRRLCENIIGASQPGDEFWKRIIGHYAALISATDADMGLVLRALEDNGILDETLVVFVADHGDTCGAHGFLSKGVVAYEELIRIPLVISWPRRFACNVRCDRLVSVMDLFPTLAEAAGIAPPANLDGHSLMLLLKGGQVSDWRTHLVVWHHGNMYGLCTMRAVIGRRYKYVYYPYDTAELYDRENDPWELDNRIDDPNLVNVASEMHSILVRHSRESGDLVDIG